jgi:tetratricopeptide (TPR) repeat protein
MKKICFRYLCVGLAVVSLSACTGLNKMKKKAYQIRFKVNPEVLEAHSGEVNLGIDTRFPADYFNKKATLTATPVLKYDGGETSFKSTSVQGESVEANNKVISTNGGSFSYKDVVGYDNAMAKSELYLNITAKKGIKSVDFEPIKIATGVLATSEKLVVMPKAILGVVREKNTTGKYNPNIDAFQRVVPDEVVADIHYIINRAEVRSSEAESSDVKDLETFTQKANQDEKINLKNVEVSAYASPDGDIDLNFDLAAKRKETSSAFLAKKLRAAGVDIPLKTKYTPEDWDGFKKLMEESNIQDKDLILRVLSMYNDPEVREREIRNLSETFTEVSEEILPKLRRAKMKTTVDFIGKSDEELMEAAKNNPSSLNPAELLYAATLFDGLEDQLSVYKSFSDIYPNDWRGPNNVGYILTKQNKYDEAKPLFEQAEKLKNDETIVKNNLGGIALVEGDVEKAEALFGQALGAGDEVNYNLGLVNVKNANYAQAVRYFANYKDVNTAIAKIMVDNTNGALKDLEAYDNDDCYMKDYMKAVIGARTGKESLLFDSLKAAIAKNPKMKDVAKTDMEFAKYFENPKFQALLD